ncbi:hypothetical protein EV426DRAFT_634844 [Tirmania nivea]|nr:hypothetical protein EV426DRAFT_634844 [Tirmania nivea]
MVNINQPSNQIKLTNVSIVRVKRQKKRFELACYKNKVLQIPQIFLNVSKGAVAPIADLQKAFPGKTNDEIILEILMKGELQLNNEVVAIVAGQCVDPTTKRVYTGSMIEKALGELREKGEKLRQQQKDGSAGEGSTANNIPIWHGVTSSRPAKALVYYQPIPIARAQCKLGSAVQDLFEKVEEVGGTVGEWECIGFVEPGKYKVMGDLAGTEMKGKGVVEVLNMAVSLVHKN